MRARLFWIVSRIAIALYRRFPLFGAVPGAIAIIRREGGILGVRRNDGLGIGLPGGIVHPWESPEKALRREVLEETGLTVRSTQLLFSYADSSVYPSRTTVFSATADGAVRSSWEGTAGVFTLTELESEMISSQRSVIEYLLKHS